MPQRSYGFAVGQVSVLEQSLIGRAALSRLLAADSVDEIARALTEFGWGELKGREDIERLCDKRMEDACALIKQVSPESEMTDCFLLKYDVMNLKVLVKSRVLGVQPGALSNCGTVDTARMLRAVFENNYKELPDELRETMERIEKRIAVEMEPLFVDSELDKTMYRMIKKRMANVKSKDIQKYFSIKADMVNLLIALRAHQMGRDARFAEELMVDGGTVDKAQAARVADNPDLAVKLSDGKPYASIVKEAISGSAQGAALTPSLALMEKRTDDYLLALIKPHRFEPTTALPLVGYLLAREREVAAVRLITIAKSAKVSEEKISARLRELYT